MQRVDDAGTVKPTTLIGTFAALCILYYVGTVVYGLCFHPLHKIPGPRINGISRIPYVRHLLAGTTVQNTTELHARYGPVVRISPSEVSFTSIEDAWQQIYGFRTGGMRGHRNMRKDDNWMGPRPFGADSVLRAHEGDHGRQRKVLSHAFSEKALLEQEEMLQGYVDKLMDRLREGPAAAGEGTNLVEWYNWTTFDVIGDLLFGESFDNLSDLRTHEHVENLFSAARATGFFYILTYFPLAKWFAPLFLDTSIPAKQKAYWDWIVKQVNRRVQRETDRPDLMSLIMRHNGSKGATLSDAEVKANAVLFIVAGSETTATLLSGVTYLLLTNPESMQKLKAEVRGLWSRYEDITLHEVGRAPYLLAVLNEGLRYYPPVPTGFPRVVAEGGETVSGYHIPAKTSVYVSSYAAHHSARNFTDPDRFDPERWLGDARYADDKLSSMQPFSFGPHACLGKNLAYGEMRLILAKMIWSFDLELAASSRRWLEDNRVFALWKKPALTVSVREVRR